MTHWRTDGQDPDYRFSLANERTFLAWVRTALAVLAGAILFHQFAAFFQPAWFNTLINLGLTAFSIFMSAFAYRRWRANEIAMRHSRPLPATLGLLVVALGAAAMGIVVGAVLAFQ